MNIEIGFAIWSLIGFLSAMILELSELRKLDSFDENWYSVNNIHWLIILLGTLFGPLSTVIIILVLVDLYKPFTRFMYWLSHVGKKPKDTKGEES